jgi:hypothetical protein
LSEISTFGWICCGEMCRFGHRRDSVSDVEPISC